MVNSKPFSLRLTRNSQRKICNSPRTASAPRCGETWTRGRAAASRALKAEWLQALGLTVAIAASIRTGDSEIATAEERIGEALKQLEKIDTIKKAADTIQKSASKIESECTAISTAIRRLLDQAIVALTGITSSSPGGAAGPADVSGAA